MRRKRETAAPYAVPLAACGAYYPAVRGGGPEGELSGDLLLPGERLIYRVAHAVLTVIEEGVESAYRLSGALYLTNRRLIHLEAGRVAGDGPMPDLGVLASVETAGGHRS